MPEYRVIWEIDVEADDPRAAARKAQDYQQRDRPDYWCGVFTTVDGEGGAVNVDLDAHDPNVPHKLIVDVCDTTCNLIGEW